MPKSDVVIDKSFLQGASKDRLRSVFEGHRVLMTESLFHELLTTDSAIRSRCFRRIPGIENPVTLVQNVGAILRWEVENQRPLSSIDEVVISERFKFNPGLVDKDFKLREGQIRVMENWRKEVSVLVHDFADHCSKVPIRFPELNGYHPGITTTHIERIKKRVCDEPGFVRELYRGGKGGTWPPKEAIDKQWAIYRWIQIKILAALDYFRKYGESDVSSETTKVENEYLDLEYCLIGCLVGAIATKDKGMSERFLTLCPSGKVLL